jgi:uncharacterized protein (TIRG00374 family)
VRLPTRIALSLGLAALLLAALMLWGEVGPRQVVATLRRLPPRVYFLALGLHVFTYCVRALRFRILMPGARRPGFRRSLVVTSAHNLASYVLPAKTGEASLVVYLRVQCGVDVATGLATLLVSRFLDAAGLCLFLSATTLWLARSGQYAALHWLGLASGCLVLGSLVFLVLCARGDLVVRGVEVLLRWLRIHRLRAGEKLLFRTNALARALRAAGGRWRITLGLLASLPMWLSVFGFFALLARAMGMPESIGYPQAVLGSSLAMLFNLLPVNGLAGVGTQELGWVTGFSRILGVDSGVALSSGIGVHIVQLVNIVALGLAAHLAMGVMPSFRNARRDPGTDPGGA